MAPLRSIRTAREPSGRLRARRFSRIRCRVLPTRGTYPKWRPRPHQESATRNYEEPVTNDSTTCTDLPLLPGGNRGNEVGAPDVEASADIARLLIDVIEPLPEPRFELLDTREVREWINRATAHLLFRSDRQELLTEAMHVLEDDWRTAMTSERLHQQAIRQQARLRAKQEGGYWRARDARRRATHPVHVLVDPAAWGRAKAAAAARRSSVGVVVGDVVSREVRRPRRRGNLPGPAPSDIRLFTRIAVQPETWAATRTLASRAGVTVERFVGVLVEDAYSSRG